MTRIEFHDTSGTITTVDANDGHSVMKTALTNLVNGIVGECGGQLSCATCHVFIDEAWTDTVGGPGDYENDMLDGTAEDRTDCSRLSCQITVTPALDGLVLHIPETQQ